MFSFSHLQSGAGLIFSAAVELVTVYIPRPRHGPVVNNREDSVSYQS